jgi:hypothetical protein
VDILEGDFIQFKANQREAQLHLMRYQPLLEQPPALHHAMYAGSTQAQWRPARFPYGYGQLEPASAMMGGPHQSRYSHHVSGQGRFGPRHNPSASVDRWPRSTSYGRTDTRGRYPRMASRSPAVRPDPHMGATLGSDQAQNASSAAGSTRARGDFSTANPPMAPDNMGMRVGGRKLGSSQAFSARGVLQTSGTGSKPASVMGNDDRSPVFGNTPHYGQSDVGIQRLSNAEPPAGNRRKEPVSQISPSGESGRIKDATGVLPAAVFPIPAESGSEVRRAGPTPAEATPLRRKLSEDKLTELHDSAVWPALQASTSQGPSRTPGWSEAMSMTRRPVWAAKSGVKISGTPENSDFHPATHPSRGADLDLISANRRIKSNAPQPGSVYKWEPRSDGRAPSAPRVEPSTDGHGIGTSSVLTNSVAQPSLSSPAPRRYV